MESGGKMTTIDIELAKICSRIYPGPTNQRLLTIAGEKLAEQHYVHGLGNRGFSRIFHNDNAVVVAFRGTRDPIDWSVTNFQFWPAPYVCPDPAGVEISVHGGFQRTLYYLDRTSGLPSIDRLCQILLEIEIGERDLWITGHSLGGAIATLFAAKLRDRHPEIVSKSLRGVVLFGSPAVGGNAFSKYYGSLHELTKRYIHNSDIVPFSPPIGFRHVGAGHWYRKGVWRADPGWLLRIGLALRLPLLWRKDHSMVSYIEALQTRA